MFARSNLSGAPSMARLGHHTQLKFVRRAEADVRADFLVVEPDGGFPVRPFEKQHDAFAIPVRRDFYVALIPRRAEIMSHGLTQKRNLHAARVRVSGVVRAQKPEV